MPTTKKRKATSKKKRTATVRKAAVSKGSHKRKTMPKKSKKTTTRRSTRSRRISGVGAVDFTGVGLTVAGAIVGQIIAKNLPDSWDGKIKNAAIAAAGLIVVPMILKNRTGNALGMGMAVGGTLGLVKELGVLNGLGSMQLLPYHEPHRLVAGTGISTQVAGTGVQQTVGRTASKAMGFALVS